MPSPSDTLPCIAPPGGGQHHGDPCEIAHKVGQTPLPGIGRGSARDPALEIIGNGHRFDAGIRTGKPVRRAHACPVAKRHAIVKLTG